MTSRKGGLITISPKRPYARKHCLREAPTDGGFSLYRTPFRGIKDVGKGAIAGGRGMAGLE